MRQRGAHGLCEDPRDEARISPGGSSNAPEFEGRFQGDFITLEIGPAVIPNDCRAGGGLRPPPSGEGVRKVTSGIAGGAAAPPQG